MEFKSIEYVGNGDIKTTYLAGEGDQDEYTVTCSDLPRPELHQTGLAILPGVLVMTLGDDAMNCLKNGRDGVPLIVTLDKMNVRRAKKAVWEKEAQFRIGISGSTLVTAYIGIKDYMGDLADGCADTGLSDKIQKFIDEALKYIKGERAQGRLFTENKITVVKNGDAG